jgi:hypothetical protein
MTVSITFQSPPQEYTQGPAVLHERRLEAVPRPKAERMAEDFVEYQSNNDTNRRKLYRYDPGDGERLVALDFEEVVALVASNGTTD